jgi:hypothetical protein
MRGNAESDDDDADDNDGDAFEDAPEDLVDMEIEDEAAFEASRREVESLYEAWDAAPPPVLSQEDVLEVLRTVCVTSFAQLHNEFQHASDTVNRLNAEFVERTRRVEDGFDSISDFRQWELDNSATYFQVKLLSSFVPVLYGQRHNISFLLSHSVHWKKMYVYHEGRSWSYSRSSLSLIKYPRSHFIGQVS